MALPIASVLIIDDKHENLFALERALTEPGIQVVKASSGNEALACLLNKAFCCVILDVEMPEMDGYEVARLIREDHQIKHVPLIFVTAHTSTEMNQFDGYRTGAVDYLFKPLDTVVLRSKVRVFAELYRRSHVIETQANELRECLTAQEQLTKALREKTDDLSRSNQELEQFASMASHDLKDPLRIVMMYVELLRRRMGSSVSEENDSLMRAILERARTMNDLIEDLIEYSRVGSAERALSTVDCNAIVTQVIENLEPMIRDAGAKITTGQLPKLDVDPVHLTQLFQNLISNALKYRAERPLEIDIAVDDGGSKEWIFSVSDNGIGIAPQFYEKIFMAFQRLHSNSAQYPGSGIGLAVCKRVVSRYGGRIWVESQPEAGSVFKFSFSKSSPKEASASLDSNREQLG